METAGSNEGRASARPLRPTEPADAFVVAQVHVHSWQAAYRGLLPAAYLDGLKVEERAVRLTFNDPDPSRPFTLVAVADQTILGFATAAPAWETDAAGQGELAGLYVDPGHWRCGIGTVLLGAAERRLVQQGFGAAVLWALEGDVRAEAFYRRQGWRLDATRRSEQPWGAAVREIRYRRSLS